MSTGVPRWKVLLADTFRRRDVKQLVAILLITAVATLYSRWDLARKDALLVPESVRHESELLPPESKADFDCLTEVQSGREYGWFGKFWGTVRVYIREKDDRAMGSFRGFEFFYRLEDGAWTQTDSASIVTPEHILEAYTSFEEAGLEVDEDAYLLKKP